MPVKNIPFKLGIHPINWVGEDVQEHGDHYTYETVMEEISSLGFKGTEVSRKFPTDIKQLKKALNTYRLQLTTQWKSVYFSDKEKHEKQLQEYREHVLFLKEFGCKVVSTAEIGGSILNQDSRRGEDERDVIRLQEDEWKYLAEGLNKAGEFCKEHGMDLVYHHHAGTVVERPEEIDKLMEMTDPNYVSLLYDSGHGYYGGSDPVELLEKYYDRIKYVHLKDVRKDVVTKALDERYPIRQSIREGMFTVPGAGDLDFTPIMKRLMECGYNGWALIEGEQNPELYNPYEYAQKSIAYLQKTIDQINEKTM